MPLDRSVAFASTRLAVGSVAPTAPASQAAPRARRTPFHPPAGSLPALLNEQWAQLHASSQAAVALARWVALPGWGARLDGAHLHDLEGIVQYVQDVGQTAGGRDEVLLGLLARCQAGEELAGRVVLQVMLPKAIRLAQSLGRHPDWTDGADEARSTVLSALWVAIATYPLVRRPGRVTANLALDTLALTQRGHTGSSWQVHTVREQPCEDLRLLAEPGHDPAGVDDLTGPADAELWTVLAWGVRTGVLQLHEARLMARVYGLDAQGDLESTAALVAEMGISWRAMRQRCNRLARRLGQAAVTSGISPVAPAAAPGSILTAA